jgi:hypothetical protein
MKISYERLNQIIEEEVVRFKKLNEDTPLAKDPAIAALDLEMDRIRGIAKTREETIRLTGLLKAVK